MDRHGSLLDQLRAYAPADALESWHHASILTLLGNASDAFSRGHFAPGHITASCFILDPAGERLLLHHHRRLDRWLQMGGHVEGGEHPAAAALREGEEESGLRDLALVGDRIFDLDVHAIPAAKGEPHHHHFDIRYVARTSDPDAIRIDRAESRDLRWVPLADAAELMAEEASSRVIRKIRSLS